MRANGPRHAPSVTSWMWMLTLGVPTSRGPGPEGAGRAVRALAVIAPGRGAPPQGSCLNGHAEFPLRFSQRRRARALLPRVAVRMQQSIGALSGSADTASSTSSGASLRWVSVRTTCAPFSKRSTFTRTTCSCAPEAGNDRFHRLGCPVEFFQGMRWVAPVHTAPQGRSVGGGEAAFSVPGRRTRSKGTPDRAIRQRTAEP